MNFTTAETRHRSARNTGSGQIEQRLGLGPLRRWWERDEEIHRFGKPVGRDALPSQTPSRAEP